MAPPHRLLRAGVLASTATALGVGGHVLAGGSIRTWAVVAAAAVAAAVAWAAAGRERGTPVIAALQVGLQQLAHTILATGAAPPADGVLPHDLMLHVHVAAGLLTALVLRAGERRTWAAARRVVARLAHWCLQILRPPPGNVRAAPPSPALRLPVQRRLLRHVLVLRGPPAATT